MSLGGASPIEKPTARRTSGLHAPVRVLVVEDSIIARAVYNRMISAEPDLALAGQAGTAEEALKLLQTLRVDVILLDLQMPGIGGLDAMPRIIGVAHGAKILVVSSLTVEGAKYTMAALSQGAADTLPKPQAGKFDDVYRASLVDRLRALGLRRSSRVVQKTPPPTLRRQPSKKPQVLAIGASTGGIHAMRHFFENLPSRIGLPILVTQHLPVSFLAAFAQQVERFAGRPARLAETGAALRPDEILIAPGNAHLLVDGTDGRLIARLSRQPSTTGCMPSVDPMLTSLAQATSGECLAMILSGMGRDGSEGAGVLAEAGGTIIVQDEESCAVWGMPGSIAKAGLATAILPPAKLADRVMLSRNAG